MTDVILVVTNQDDKSCHHHYEHLISEMCMECGSMLSDDVLEPSETGTTAKTIRVKVQL
jgi:hypothetical protein